MKKIIIILAIAFVINCRAQSPVINIKDQDGHPIQGAYYKDIDNALNPFEGTYIYTNGSETLKIVLQKKTMSDNTFHYADLLIGEYQYIQNGVEKANTLNELNLVYPNQYKHSFHLNGVLQTGDYLCLGCVGNEVRLFGGMIEYSTDNWAQIILGKTVVSGQEALTMNVIWQMKWRNETVPPGAHPSFMGGNWVLIKQ